MAENTKNNELVAFSKSLARAKKDMGFYGRKMFFCVLEKISWNAENSNIVELDKKEVIEKLGIKTDANHRSKILRDVSSELRHCEIKFNGEDKENWEDGWLITTVQSTRSKLAITINSEYMPLLQNLGKNRDYITLWANDVYMFQSDRSYILYEYFRLHSDTRKTNTVTLSTKQIKELFDIPQNAYMHHDKKKNVDTFDRANFEKKVIDVVCEDLSKTQMIGLCLDKNTKKFYRKKKNGRIVAGYEFTFTINNAPALGNAKEIIDIETDHEIIKIAKDIKKNRAKESFIKSKNQEKKSKNKFNEFEQNKYDFLEIENILVEQTTLSDFEL